MIVLLTLVLADLSDTKLPVNKNIIVDCLNLNTL